jgi:xylulokinase
MAELFIGLDVGTTATKALLFDLDGRVLASATCGYRLLTPQPDWVEQDPEEIWQAVVKALRSITRECGPHDHLVALGQSSQGGTTIPVDARGGPLHQAFSWMDQRAGPEAEQVRAAWGAEALQHLTGWPLMSGLPLNHIAWYRRNCPVEFAATARLLFVNDFIGQRLTGQYCMNPSDASITQLMNLATGDWDNRLLEVAGIERRQLSPIQPSSTAVGLLTQSASEATGLPPGMLVVNGAHDQYCAAVGTGVTRPGQVLLSCGTAWVTLAVPESLEVGLHSGLAISRHAVENRWGAIRSLGGVGASLEWLLDNVWGGAQAGAERGQLYQALNAGVARVSAGAEGVLFLPLAGGHAAGYGSARGGFLNLALEHSRDHLARAVMEGTVFELRWAIEEMRAKGIQVTKLVMVGGAAKSSAWPQIVADVLGISVAMPEVKDAAACGAAILAGVGAGLFGDPDSGAVAWRREAAHLNPTAEYQTCYDEAYARYRQAVHDLASSTTGGQ